MGEKPESDKHSMSTFSRLRDASKRSTGRPGTSDGTVKRDAKESEKKLRAAESEREPETEKEQEKEKPKTKVKERKERAVSLSPSKERDPHLLRKRTSSAAEHPARSPPATSKVAGGPNIKPGQSILEQIGTPDHNGWLRKKGDRYNTWKQRYFVLKGPHLYWLRSENKSVCVKLANGRHRITDIDMTGLRRRRRSRAISTSQVTRSWRTRRSTRGVMASGSCMTRISLTISAQTSSWSSENG